MPNNDQKATEMQRIFSGWNAILRAKIREGRPSLFWPCLLAFLAFQRSLHLHTPKPCFRPFSVTFRACLGSVQSWFCHLGCVSCMCRITPLIAYQRSMSFLHALIMFQWVFRLYLACHVSEFFWFSGLLNASYACSVIHVH